MLNGKKKWLVELSGSREAAIQNRTAIYLGGAAIAEYVIGSDSTEADSSPISSSPLSRRREFDSCPTQR